MIFNILHTYIHIHTHIYIYITQIQEPNSILIPIFPNFDLINFLIAYRKNCYMFTIMIT